MNKFEVILETHHEKTYKSIGCKNTIIVTLIEMDHFLNDFFTNPTNLNDFPICWKLQRIQFNQFEIEFAYDISGKPFRIQITDTSKSELLRRVIVFDKANSSPMDKIIYRDGTVTSIFIYSPEKQCFTDINTASINLDTKACKILKFNKDDLYRFALPKYNSVTRSLFLINDIFGLTL